MGMLFYFYHFLNVVYNLIMNSYILYYNSCKYKIPARALGRVGGEAKRNRGGEASRDEGGEQAEETD